MKKMIYTVLTIALLSALFSCASKPSEPPSVIYPDPLENPGAYTAPHGGPVK